MHVSNTSKEETFTKCSSMKRSFYIRTEEVFLIIKQLEYYPLRQNKLLYDTLGN